MIIRLATQSDNEQICAIMSQVSMGDTLSLVFERSPDYFVGSAIQSEQAEVYVFTNQDKVEGVFSVGKRRV